MAQKKQAIEVHCTECGAGFRLWVPADTMAELESGLDINCVKCGAHYLIKNGEEGPEVSLVSETTAFEPSAEEPVAAAAAAPEPKAKAKVQAGARAAAPAQATGGHTDTVLFIEDDKLAREMAEETLKDAGVKLILVRNATDALKTLRGGKVNLIVTDMYLRNPGDPESLMDGEDLLKRAADMGLNIPAIITTGKDIIDDIVLDPKWFDLHVKGFIQKGNPFWVEELKTKIKEVLYKD